MKVLRFLSILIVLVFLASCSSKRTVSSGKRVNNVYIDADDEQRAGEAIEEVEDEEEPNTDLSSPIVVKKIEEADLIFADLKRRKPNLNTGTMAYIEEYNDIAILEMMAYDIPASITLAQGILESNSGKSRLAVRGNNHFGVKCHRSWEGKRLYHDDDAKQECFRKYAHPLSSFRDHSLFLYGRDRYAALFELRKTNYKGWARGLKKAGYATDPKYPHKLIQLIDLYELDKYDHFGKDFKYAGKVIRKEDTNLAQNSHIVVNKGDTLYSIARKHNVSVERLKWLNGLKSNEISIGQKLLLE